MLNLIQWLKFTKCKFTKCVGIIAVCFETNNKQQFNYKNKLIRCDYFFKPYVLY